MFNLKKIAEATYELPKEEGMKVPALIIASEEILSEVEMEKPLMQVKNVAHLPGIVGHSIAMPDIHWGYGFPIGGVAATDADNGVISPGGVGYDINCGVRLAIIPVGFSSLSHETQEKLLQSLYEKVPSGVGHGHRGEGLSQNDYKEIIEKGARWSVESGFGLKEDLMHCESLGYIEGGDLAAISPHARDRGEKQLGSIGSGNHFLEVGEVAELIDDSIAKQWNIEKGWVYVLIHSGSRGFGHQICQDTLQEFLKEGFAQGLPDKQLVAAPIQSPQGKKYFAAMAGAANYAFNNRQRILHFVREAFREVLSIKPEEVRLLYDVCHNIAKFEEHGINGKKTRLCVHRKGATRSFGVGSRELAPIFQKTGQPVLVPGDMGRASYILAGKGNPKTWSSCCHGAGRAKSRMQSMKNWGGRDLKEHMRKQGIAVKAASNRTIAEEMPDAYKNVDLVVEAVEQAQLASRVAKLKPRMVVKG